jgi:hypothetical protein
MKQRGFVLPALATMLPWIIGGVAVAALAGWAWWKYEHYCNAACQTQKDIAEAAILRVGTLEEAIAVAQKRATDLALLWSDAINQERTVYVKVVEYRDRVFTRYRDRIAGVGVSGRITVADDARVLLGDAARSAREAAGDPSAAGRDSQPAEAVSAPAGSEVETDSREWIAFAVSASEAYADAAGKHKACVEAYGRIREASQ